MVKLLAVVACLPILLGGCSTMNQKEHHDCLVTSKDERQVISGSDGSTYTSYQKLVSTSCGVFEVSDSIAGGWQSYDRWAAIKEGHRYDIRTGGYRWFGGFPDVLDVKEIR